MSMKDCKIENKQRDFLVEWGKSSKKKKKSHRSLHNPSKLKVLQFTVLENGL